MPKFTVDTHLFRELGEMLVGRDSTAVMELVKNAYDADATEIIVHAQNLDDPIKAAIEILDDGVGMTKQEFEQGFLRIASRLRDTGTRRSRKFNRRYTGAKGVGRLAAHKLASYLAVDSIPEDLDGRTSTGIYAEIDWRKVESLETLDDIEGTDALSVKTRRPKAADTPGTVLHLRHLRAEVDNNRTFSAGARNSHVLSAPRNYRFLIPAYPASAAL